MTWARVELALSLRLIVRATLLAAASVAVCLPALAILPSEVVFPDLPAHTIWLEAESGAVAGAETVSDQSAYGGALLRFPTRCPGEVQWEFQPAGEEPQQLWLFAAMSLWGGSARNVWWQVDEGAWQSASGSVCGRHPFGPQAMLRWTLVGSPRVGPGRHTLRLAYIPAQFGEQREFLLDAVYLLSDADRPTVRLTGSALPEQVEVGKSYRLQLLVEPAVTLPAGTEVVLETWSGEQLLDRTPVAASPPPEQWQAGQQVRLGEIPFVVPAGVPPGLLTLRLDIGQAKLAGAAGPENEVGSVQVRPPSPPAPRRTARLISLTLPRSAPQGNPFPVALQIVPTVRESGFKQAVLFLEFYQEGQLFWVKQIPVGRTPEQWASGKQMQIGPAAVELPGALLPGEYQVAVGLYGFTWEQGGSIAAQKDFTIAASGKPGPGPGQSLGYGSFRDRDSTWHRWYVNRGNTLFWDGEPYLPVGTAFRFSPPSVSGEGDSLSQADLTRLDTLAARGVRDVLLEGEWTLSDLSSASLARQVEALEDKRFTYGIALDCNSTCVQEGYVVRGHAGAAPFEIRPEVMRGSATYQATIPLDGLPPVIDVKNVLCLVVDENTGQAFCGRTAFQLDGANRRIQVEVSLRGLAQGHPHRAIFIPQVVYLARSADVWRGTEELESRLRSLLSAVQFGPGLRFLLDPFHAQGQGGEDALLLSSPSARQAFADWLSRRYATPVALAQAWGLTREPVDFAQAARLVPGQVGPPGTVWQDRCFLVDDAALEVFPALYSRCRMWYDYLQFKEESLGAACAKAAEIVRATVNVPLLFSHGGDGPLGRFVNRNPIGGFAGIGVEAFGHDAGLVALGAAGPAAETMASAHTLWMPAVRTALSTQASLPYPRRLGNYPSLSDLVDEFGALMQVGVKGFFIAPLPMQGSPVGADAMADLACLDWLNAYSELLAANRSRVAEFRAAWYPALAPGGMRALPGDAHDVFYRDDMEVPHPGLGMNGVWVLPSATLGGAGGTAFLAISGSPASQMLASDLERALNEKELLIFCGLRRDRGALPAIDGFFTDQFLPDADGRTAQVLVPTPTARPLRRFAGEHVWSLQDGSLQIVAKEGAFPSPDAEATPRVMWAQLPLEHTPPKVMDDVLQAQCLPLADGVEAVVSDAERGMFAVFSSQVGGQVSVTASPDGMTVEGPGGASRTYAGKAKASVSVPPAGRGMVVVRGLDPGSMGSPVPRRMVLADFQAGSVMAGWQVIQVGSPTVEIAPAQEGEGGRGVASIAPKASGPGDALVLVRAFRGSVNLTPFRRLTIPLSGRRTDCTLSVTLRDRAGREVTYEAKSSKFTFDAPAGRVLTLDFFWTKTAALSLPLNALPPEVFDLSQVAEVELRISIGAGEGPISIGDIWAE